VPPRRRRAPRLPECGYTLDGRGCRKRGDHLCEPRARHVRAFFEEVLVHTKGRYRGKRFVLARWQWTEVIRPLFGTVVWSAEAGEYVRQYRIAWIEIARKNGKTELLAGCMLYLLVADGEQGAELYGVARDKDQAALAFDVAMWMVRLSPVLRRRLQVKEHNRRIVDPKLGGVYAVIAADAAGALGSNPSGVAADEILAWRDRSMWDAMRTGMGSGARRAPLMIAATTAGTTSAVFAAGMHSEMQRIADDPARAPHIFVYLRNVPMEADPWDERGWKQANPALGDFLSLAAMREEAMEAKNDPQTENAFRQFKLNQWVQQATRWMPMHLYDACEGEPWLTPEYRIDQLEGRLCHAGLDLAARQDLTAWCLVFPDEDELGADVWWRFWLPEAALPDLDKLNDGRVMQWVRQGWITVTDGNVLDYEVVYADIETDAERFDIVSVDADRWSLEPVVQAIGERTGLEPVTLSQTYTAMTPGMTSLMDLVVDAKLRHHGNPVARWCFDNVEARRAPYDPELIRPDKPERHKTGKRIDAVPTASMAVGAWKGRAAAPAAAVPNLW
jgi:phage terminase large subunit-like protein